MTERAQPTADRATACPFVAFEDDRDARADRPDHRHRCYADLRPAPRALAHQDAYCLSASFPSCPTFQDWARREAAAARPTRPPEASAVVESSPATPASDQARPAIDHARPAIEPDPWVQPTAAEAEPGLPPRRAQQRDWAAPPHWAGEGPNPAGGDTTGAATAGLGAAGLGAAAAGTAAAGDADHDADAPADDAHPPAFLADRPAARPPDRERPRGDEPATAHPDEPRSPATRGLADTPAGRGSHEDAADEEDWNSLAAASTPSRTFGRSSSAADRGRHGPDDGPAWERPRRYEAYPTLKTRVGMPSVQPLAAAAVAIVIAALALFFIPPLLLNLGSNNGPGASASASAAAAASNAPSASPTAPAAPTPLVYVVKAGDTLSKIAKRFGVTVDQIVEANKTTIKDPNKIKLGDRITIPTPSPSDLPEASPAAS